MILSKLLLILLLLKQAPQAEPIPLQAGFRIFFDGALNWGGGFIGLGNLIFGGNDEAPRRKFMDIVEDSRRNFHTMVDKERAQLYHVAESDAQAPGLPTDKDGFKPKKNWNGEKVKHPKTGQVGWPDGKGNVWVPTGTGPKAHGGPHWDVVDKSGKHKNILPGGKERGKK